MDCFQLNWNGESGSPSSRDDKMSRQPRKESRCVNPLTPYCLSLCRNQLARPFASSNKRFISSRENAAPSAVPCTSRRPEPVMTRGCVRLADGIFLVIRSGAKPFRANTDGHRRHGSIARGMLRSCPQRSATANRVVQRHAHR